MSNELEVIASNSRSFVGAFHDVVITVWRQDIEAGDVRASEQAQVRAGRHTGRFGAIAYVEPKALQIQEAARTEAARITEQAGGRLVGVGVVIPLGGFTGSIARTVASGIHLMSRSRSPQKVFATVDEAASWVLSQLGRAPNDHNKLTRLTEAVQAARSHQP